MSLAGATRIFELMDELPEQDNGYVTLVYAEKDERGKYKISNPVMDDENFAEKWASEPEKAKALLALLA